MQSIYSYLPSWFPGNSSTKDTTPASSLETPEGNSFYTLNEKGFKVYLLDNLSITQAKVAQNKCEGTVTWENRKGAALTLEAWAISGAILFASLVIAKIAAPFFIAAFLQSTALAAHEPAVRVCTHLGLKAAALFGAYKRDKAVWEHRTPTINSHWEKAAHYEEQAEKLSLHRAKLLDKA